MAAIEPYDTLIHTRREFSTGETLHWPVPAPSWTCEFCGWTVTYTGITEADLGEQKKHLCVVGRPK